MNLVAQPEVFRRLGQGCNMVQTACTPGPRSDSSALNSWDANSIFVSVCGPARTFPGGIQLDLGSCMARHILFRLLISCFEAFHSHTPSLVIFGVFPMGGLTQSNALVFLVEYVHF